MRFILDRPDAMRIETNDPVIILSAQKEQEKRGFFDLFGRRWYVIDIEYEHHNKDVDIALRGIVLNYQDFCAVIACYAVVEARTRYAPNACPGHVASASDPKICAHCGTHVREEADTEEDSP